MDLRKEKSCHALKREADWHVLGMQSENELLATFKNNVLRTFPIHRSLREVLPTCRGESSQLHAPAAAAAAAAWRAADGAQLGQTAARVSHQDHPARYQGLHGRPGPHHRLLHRGHPNLVSICKEKSHRTAARVSHQHCPARHQDLHGCPRPHLGMKPRLQLSGQRLDKQRHTKDTGQTTNFCTCSSGDSTVMP
jgi:hypothetical protein